jgi:hypothetical protein
LRQKIEENPAEPQYVITVHLALPTDGYDFKVFRLDMGCPIRGAVMF